MSDLDADKNSKKPDSIEENLILNSLDMMDWIQEIQYKKSEANFERLLSSAKQTAERQTFLSKLIRNITVTFTGQKFVEITEIEIPSAKEAIFWGGNIESLKAGDKLYSNIGAVSGWILGRQPVTMVRLATTEMGIADAPVNISRPDVRKAYSFATTTDISGFKLIFNFNILPSQGTLQLEAIFADAQVIPFIFIKYQKYSGLWG
jgi:hypothetical protein